MANKSLSDEEKTQARDIYAKMHIYADEYAKRSAQLPLAFRQKVALQIKLQKAQFLARLYSEQLSSEVEATDDEIASYFE
jgi:hypothetical protein